MSECCCLTWRRPIRRQQGHRSKLLRPVAATVPSKLKTETHSSWDCFFRHLQRLPSLSMLSLQRCGLEDRDVRSLSIALQILPAGRLRCLRLDGNCVGLSGLRMLLTALTSRRMRLPALWLRKQRPPLVESESKGIVEAAFRDGLFAEVTEDVRGGGGLICTIIWAAVVRSVGSVRWQFYRRLAAPVSCCFLFDSAARGGSETSANLS